MVRKNVQVANEIRKSIARTKLEGERRRPNR